MTDTTHIGRGNESAALSADAIRVAQDCGSLTLLD